MRLEQNPHWEVKLQTVTECMKLDPLFSEKTNKREIQTV